MLEKFSIKCRRTKTKIITLSNHNKDKLHDEPIRTWHKRMWMTSTAGKPVRARHDFFCFVLSFTAVWLRKLHKLFEPITERSKVKPKKKGIIFDTHWKLLYFTSLDSYWENNVFLWIVLASGPVQKLAEQISCAIKLVLSPRKPLCFITGILLKWRNNTVFFLNPSQRVESCTSSMDPIVKTGICLCRGSQ